MKRASLLMECAESWHVDAGAKDEDGEEVCELHYMLDPGDGLCSTAVRGVAADVAEMWAGSYRAAQREKALLDALLRLQASAGRVLAGDGDRKSLSDTLRLVAQLVRRAIDEHQRQLRADVEATAAPDRPITSHSDNGGNE